LIKIILWAACAAVGLSMSPVYSQSAPEATNASIPEDMADRVQACAPCHGAQGQGTANPYFPWLSGKPAGYLYNQLVAFQEGRRRYAPMNYLLEFQTPAYLGQMAAWFAAQHPPAPPRPVVSVSATVLAHGQDLVAHGAPDRGIPPCSGCHGPGLTGMEPAIPGLVGLNTQYITAQLGAWRYGTRTAAEPDCMQLVAAHLTEDDVAAVAAWLASRPVPPDATPVPAGTLRMPLSCGSERQ
jgi:cytochrome c553